MEIKVTKDNAETLDELRDELISIINKYSHKVNGYELVGVIDVVREDCHSSIQELDEE